MHHGNQTCAEIEHQLQYQADFTLVSRIITCDLSRIPQTQRLNSLFLVSTTGHECACLFEFHGHETIPTWSAVTCVPELLEEVQWASLISALWKSGSDSKQERSWKNSVPRKLHWGGNQPNLNMILFSNVVKYNLIWSYHHINILTTICLK